MQKSILISSYLDMNIGDSLLLETILNYYKDHCIYVIGDNPFTYQWIIKQFSNVNIIQSYQITTVFLDRITDFVMLGGSIFQHNTWYEGILRYKTLKQIKKYKKHNIRIHIVDCNIGPIKTRIGLGSTKRILKLADSVSCRDVDSYKLINKWAPKTKSNMFMDLVFARKFPNKLSHAQFTIGISVYTAYIISLINKNQNYCEQIIKIIERYNNRDNLNVKLFIFDTFRNNDFPNAYRIREWCIDNGIHCEIIFYSGNSNLFIESMRTCDVIIGTRFHSIVMSMKIGIPCLPIVYSNKTDSLLNSLNYKNERIIFGDDPDKLLKHNYDLLAFQKDEIDSLTVNAQGHLTFLDLE